MLKKVLKWFLASREVLLVLTLSFAAFVYFSIDDRLTLPEGTKQTGGLIPKNL
jgi:hypothetical protein